MSQAEKTAFWIRNRKSEIEKMSQSKTKTKTKTEPEPMYTKKQRNTR
jgi:hypothetical protein